ncbi:MAG: hypothetical protein HYT90_05410 [Candidatus Omnitrophica bacterium]|nr:hypothetical protein [Candidatus Omnitrophota bacterium]
MTRARPRDNRGFVLISSYLMLFLFFIYSNALTMQTMTQRTVADRAREQLQATNLAQGAMEQLSDEFYQFLAEQVYALHFQNNAIQALQWLDTLGNTITSGGLVTSTVSCAPCLSYEYDANGALAMKSNFSGGLLDGVAANPRLAKLPAGDGKSWIASITSTDPANALATRQVTLIGEATVGGTTKRIQAVYDIVLGMSDIFRYSYFVNNYGWFSLQDVNQLYIRGEVRANGDMAFNGSTWRMWVDGDLYAAKNPELVNPVTKQPATGGITGDPAETANQKAYWQACDTAACDRDAARPTRKLTVPGQPAIGGSEKVLPYGKGWDSDKPNQTKYDAQTTQPIPYLGDLNFYKSLALQKSSKLTYYDSAAKKTQTISAVYSSDKPLVLVGTWANPIVLDGPIVVPGDVIIKGYVKGRGTIYAGRNVHVVGDLQYVEPPQWVSLERNEKTGRIAQRGYGPYSNYGYSQSNLGTVCKSGSYYKPGESVPGGCM